MLPVADCGSVADVAVVRDGRQHDAGMRAIAEYVRRKLSLRLGERDERGTRVLARHLPAHGDGPTRVEPPRVARALVRALFRPNNSRR
jgi:hypothetical protein